MHERPELFGRKELVHEEYTSAVLKVLEEEEGLNADDFLFPLLTKIIDAKSDLSIQVYPDDAYAAVNENGSLGKTECWYIMDAASGATIVIGHNAKDHNQVKSMIEQRQWGDFIREVPVHKGDFFFIEPGTVHAIKGGAVILETQQSSDITYRVYDYDYDRLQDGKPRQLHVRKSIDVIKAPYQDRKPPLNANKAIGNGNIRQLISCDLFTVWHGKADGRLEVEQTQPFLLCSVIDGECLLSEKKLMKGDHFIFPFNYGTAILEGNAELIFSSI